MRVGLTLDERWTLMNRSKARSTKRPRVGLMGTSGEAQATRGTCQASFYFEALSWLDQVKIELARENPAGSHQ